MKKVAEIDAEGNREGMVGRVVVMRIRTGEVESDLRQLKSRFGLRHPGTGPLER